MRLETNIDGSPTVVYGDRGRERFVLPRGRDDFVPTPLDPHNVMRDDGTPYVLASLEKIHELVDDVQERGQHPDWLTECVRSSLMASAMKRCEQNSSALVRHKANVDLRAVDEDFERTYERARAGVADIDELFYLAAHPKGLGAVEIAKISHPLDWHATKPMDEAVGAAIEAYDGATFIDKSIDNRYKFQDVVKDSDGNALAVVVGRKRDFARIGNLVVVKRSSLIIRLDDNLDEDQQVPDSLKLSMKDALAEADTVKGSKAYQKYLDEYIQSIAASTIEPVLAAQIGERPSWIAPTATSYYCKATDRQFPEYKIGRGDTGRLRTEVSNVERERASRPARVFAGSAAVGSRPYSLQP